MTEIRSSQAGLEDGESKARRVSKISNRDQNRSEEPPQLPTEPDYRPKPSTKHAPPITDVSEAAATFRQAFPSIYNARTPSNRSSSSSLQALNEDTVVDARSKNASVGRSPRRSSRQSENELPVYPDQSYASLQSQIHPTWQPPHGEPHPLPRYSSYARGIRSAGNTPVSSPGLFSMRHPRKLGTPSGSDDDVSTGSSLLHPSHLQPPKETHTAAVDRDIITGNKTINQYEILQELGRGEHGKVKLGQHIATGQQVAIKIVQRYSSRRRLGKLGNPEDKVKKEVAILKKARHPNVVSLLEVIDDPNRQKVYIVLEYVENGEIVWRKKGVREIVHVDKLRLEREKSGIPDTPAFLEESHQFIRTAQHLRRQRERARERIEAQAADAQQGPIPAWSLEHGAESSDEDEETGLPIRRSSSRSVAVTDDSSASSAQDASLNAVEGTMYGAYSDYPFERRFSTASSSFGYPPSEPDWSAEGDDMAYVPCLTIGETRSAFRDSVLGLEYLHYQGIIHRDIKPANLLVTSNHRVKISDFGVSYLGRPMRDEEEERLGETDATELDDARELSKTVGTPAFYAPELCYTGDDFVETLGSIPKITGAIDVWSLGVTLYGMIFGRLPFLSDDEYSMFQTIVKKEVFIPRKRLVPVVENECDSNQQNLRNNDELVYEDIDDELYDLLRRLLTKDPIKRITLKEIKHHPWTLHGLPNPRIWIEESDPGYQSKGKKIEVSNEEVTSAVSKVPFIQRVRSNVAKWFGGKSKDKESRKRPSSLTTSTETLSSTVSNGTFGRNSHDSRRSSLRGDEDVFRPLKFSNQGHPLAQSVTASPVDNGDWDSYFDAAAPSPAPTAAKSFAADKFAAIPPLTVTPRPSPPRRAKSSMSTTESTKTIKANSFDVPLTVRPRSGVHSSIIEALGQTNFGSLFSGTARRSSRGSRSRRSSMCGEIGPLQEADEHVIEPSTAEPSIAISNASAQGQVRTTGLWHDGASATEKLAPIHAHRRNRSSQLSGPSPEDSFHLTRDALRRRRSDIESNEGATLRVDYAMYSTESLLLPPIHPPTNQCPENTKNGLTSTPATVSSSSADDFTSGMSQSASHPSIPSVVSNASSLSGDGHSCKDAAMEEVPSILRTGETVKPSRPNSPPRHFEEDESRYYCDDEDDSDEEVLMIGNRKPAKTDSPSH